MNSRAGSAPQALGERTTGKEIIRAIIGNPDAEERVAVAVAGCDQRVVDSS